MQTLYRILVGASVAGILGALCSEPAFTLVAEPALQVTIPITLPNGSAIPIHVTEGDDLWATAENFLNTHGIDTSQFWSSDMRSMLSGFQSKLWQERMRHKRVAALVASRNRPDLVANMHKALRAEGHLGLDIIVAECGTEDAKLSEHSTVRYEDPQNIKGKTYCHNQALQHAHKSGKYDYILVLMNDLVWDPREGPLVTSLVHIMESFPNLGMLSPTNYGEGRDFPGALNRTAAQAAPVWRPAAAVDYLCMMIRSTALQQTGFLDPIFRYSQGAEHELAYRMWTNSWTVAYTDSVRVKHLGGSTYGAKGTGTVDRTTYLIAAMRFGKSFFTQKYGERWDLLFWRAASSRANIEFNTFTWWKKALDAVLEKIDAGTHTIKV